MDIWGQAHPVRSVDIILTRSQFKAYGWLREHGMTWKDYWDAFRDYNHALYITNLSKDVYKRQKRSCSDSGRSMRFLFLKDRVVDFRLMVLSLIHIWHLRRGVGGE